MGKTASRAEHAYINVRNWERGNAMPLNLIRLPLENVKNCRDLGGYPTPQGITKWRSFLRSGDLGRMNDQEGKVLHDFGVRSVIDLRSPEECELSPNPLAADPRFRYTIVDLIPRPLDGETFMTRDLSKITLGDLYVSILEHKRQIQRVFTQIADAPAGAVLFHCTAGKDRTGVVAMLLLGLAGVDEKDILCNYQVSSTYLDITHEVLRRVPVNMLESRPEYLKQAMDHIQNRYGNIEKYFEACGLDASIQSKILSRMIE